MTEVALSKHWNVYLDSIREHAHQLLAWSYADALPKIDADTDEPSITGFLCEAMKRRINDPDTPEVYAHYAVGDQEPVSPSGESGNHRLRLDINILRTGIRPQLGYVLEAKRLKTGGFSIGKYVGDGGMGDFLSCRYGKGAPEGAMVGLWQDKDPAYWLKELQRIYTEDEGAKAPKLSLRSRLTRFIVNATMPSCYRSEHRRADETNMVLLHVFLCATGR